MSRRFDDEIALGDPGTPHDDGAATLPPSSTPRSPNVAPRSPTKRFEPGSVVAGRYRLVALLGKGGMGEVYRAEDLTLDQPVALKFLPEGVAVEGPVLAQFHNELRIARQVSHKNVCRLYDLGEADGRRFLTMEYVDGEDLASLLRRIGRIPQDKAIQLARQLCAGLSAAHEKGVLHRDLKPANVMIDGSGDVRLTDFGIAVAAGDAGATLAGTPQYMAPEQLKGSPATVATDIYSLGLILFELFTGKRTHDAKSVAEVLEFHKSGVVATPTTVVKDLDPAIERVIMRCLDRDAAKRPQSALAVAASLPGHDPLADALAAGETPSPEVVAAAGQISALKPLVGLGLVTAILIGIAAVATIADRTFVNRYIPLNKSLDVLADRASDIATRLGYTEPPAATAGGLVTTNEGLNYLVATDKSKDRWARMASGAYPAIRYWYRSSPRLLLQLSNDLSPTIGDPPPTLPGMVAVELDTTGRLTRFAAVPPQRDPPRSAAPADWSKAFEAAGLTMSNFTPVEPEWNPPDYADERHAWEGPLFDEPVRVRIEAASYRGTPVYFALLGPWSRPISTRQNTSSARSTTLNAISFVVPVSLIVGSLILARRHVRNRRGDIQGALAVTGVYFGLLLVIWLLEARHFSDLRTEYDSLARYIGPSLYRAGLIGLWYFALEPFVRKYCPEILFSWTRAIRGRFRDPLVGRDLLCAAAIGLALALVTDTFFLYYRDFVALRQAPSRFLNGPAAVAAQLIRMTLNGPTNAMVLTFVYVIARAVTKRPAIAACTAFVLMMLTVMSEWGNAPWLSTIALSATFSGLLVFALLRFGVLAVAVATTVSQIVNQSALTTDLSRSYAGTSVSIMLLVAALALFSFFASRGDESLFGAAFD